MKQQRYLFLLIACFLLISSLSACSTTSVSIDSIYKGEPTKITFNDRRGSGAQYTVTEKGPINDLMNILRESKLEKIKKEIEDHTGGQSFLMQIFEDSDLKLSLLYDSEYVVINSIQYNLDKNSREKLMNFYNNLIK